MIRDFVLVAKAVADPTRARILKMLEPGELCVCDITAGLDLAQSTVSKHLGILRNAGLIVGRKVGLWVYYRLETAPINPHNLAFLRLTAENLTDVPEVRRSTRADDPCCLDMEESSG